MGTAQERLDKANELGKDGVALLRGADVATIALLIFGVCTGVFYISGESSAAIASGMAACVAAATLVSQLFRGRLKIQEADTTIRYPELMQY